MKSSRSLKFKVQSSKFNKKNCFRFVFSCFLIFASCIFLTSCGGDDEAIAPKPRGYFRLQFPEKKYIKYDSVCPFTFEMPGYAVMDRDIQRNFTLELQVRKRQCSAVSGRHLYIGFQTSN